MNLKVIQKFYIDYDFCVKFERPSNKYSKAEKRKALATGVYNTFVNK